MIARRLFGRGFGALVSSQFCGAVNDNVLKQVLVFMVTTGIWAGQLGEGGQGWVQVAFSAPFILLAGWAGWLSDRFCKRRVSVLVRATEIPIALLALVGFWTRSLALTYFALVLLTCQSAFFGPAKYGMIPEVVDRSDVSRANGAINMLTNIAVIVGTVAAGFIADAYAPRAADGTVTPGLLWLPGVFLVAIAVCGLFAVLPMPTLGAKAPDLSFPLNPLRPVVVAVRDMAGSPLLLVALAWGWFYLLGGIGLLALPEYATLLGTSNAAVSGLLGALGLSIGVGSLVAGLVSGDRVRPELVPFGAAGLLVGFLLLGFFSLEGIVACAIFVSIAGFAAGFWIIPLQALIQVLAPDDERGRFVGVQNAVSFSYLTLAGGVYVGLKSLFGIRADHMFLITAGLTVVGVVVFGGWWQLRRRAARAARETGRGAAS